MFQYLTKPWVWLYYQQISNCCRLVLTYWLTDLCHQWLTDCWSCTAFRCDVFFFVAAVVHSGHVIFNLADARLTNGCPGKMAIKWLLYLLPRHFCANIHNLILLIYYHDERVYLSVWITHPIFNEFSVHGIRGRGSVFIWRRCDTPCELPVLCVYSVHGGQQ